MPPGLPTLIIFKIKVSLELALQGALESAFQEQCTGVRSVEAQVPKRPVTPPHFSYNLLSLRFSLESAFQEGCRFSRTFPQQASMALPLAAAA